MTEKYHFDPHTQSILEHMPVPFAVYQYIDKRVVTIALSQGFCDQFGFKSHEDAYNVMDNDMYRATHPDDKTRVADAAYRYAAFDAPYDIVYRTRTLKDPDYIVLHSYGTSIYPEGKDGIRLCLTWYAYEGKYSEEEGNYESILNETLNRFLTEESHYRGMYYDYMTGLPNMTYFYELAEAGLKSMQEKDIDSAVLFFDLTGLKHFNQEYGFAEGDRLLCSVASILAKHFSNENCARFAQDHFAAFASTLNLEETLDAIIEECASCNEGRNLPLRIGIYNTSIESVEIGTACDRAKMAADVKKNRRNDESFYTFFDLDMLTEEKNRQAIIDNLDRAIAEGWIKVFYQPIVRSVNSKVCDVEALARWDDPERGLLPPYLFIPVLEEANLIHKLDLCIVRQVLEDLQKPDIPHVPASINFSRADFDACDLVEEITRLVDSAGIDHKWLNIEITESMVGSDFDYMKEQIKRFQNLGFQVWMDDFGSGYSSLDVLQSIHFDLLKFDMSFMKRLDEGENGKIILTEMMRMATSLGVDTICEGVETEEQVKFLREIGCSKLQGFYFAKPSPRDIIIQEFHKHKESGIEDPRESAYFDTVGRLNLYDLSFLANVEIKNTFDAVPMSIIEVSGDKARYVRTNQSFRDFMKGKYQADVSDKEFPIPKEGTGALFMKEIQKDEERTFIDEEQEDGSVVHSFARKIGKNPVTGKEAYATAVLHITEPNTETRYAKIARALAADFSSLYYVNLKKEDYIEYSKQHDEIATERRGTQFFDKARNDALKWVYEEDREAFLSRFTKENILDELSGENTAFSMIYRLVDSGYTQMKVSRMDANHIIIATSNIDARMKQEEEERQLRQERVSLGRVAALSSNYIVLYTIDPETSHYTMYNPTGGIEKLGLATQGEDFFLDVILTAPGAVDLEDMERHLRVLTKENMLREIKEHDVFIHNYRMIMDGKLVPVSLRATLIEEDEGQKILVGVSRDDREEYRRRLEEAYEKERDTSIIYKHLALSLARGYTDLYYVNIDTDDFIEFHTDDESGVLTAARRGTDFFEGCERDAKLFVHPEDQDLFVHAMNREFLKETLKDNRVYEFIYRRIKEGRTFYVRMKVSRIEDDSRYVVIAVSDINEEIRHKEEENRIREERRIYARLHALTGNYIAVYVVDPETDKYREFNATDNYVEAFSQAKEGTNFFSVVREAARVYNDPADLERFLAVFTKENVLEEIERSGIFTLGYRLMMEGAPHYVQMKAVMVEGELIVGLSDVDVHVRQEEEYKRRLAQAQTQANIDDLTGIRNKHALSEFVKTMNEQIEKSNISPFAVLLFDVNDLKKMNDTEGHQAGDEYLKFACKVICDIFKRSPVFRVGGDEFAVIVQGRDHDGLKELLEKITAHNADALQNGGVVIACGVAEYTASDTSIESVFDRADQAMYANKKELKR